MRRPLVRVGLLFVIGELAYRMLEESVIYTACLILIGITICLITNKSVISKKKILSNKSTHFRCADLLLFFCILLGYLWAYGYYAGRSNSVFENSQNLSKIIEFDAYVQKVEEGENSFKITLEADKTRFIMYEKKETPFDKSEVGKTSSFDKSEVGETSIEPGWNVHIVGKLSEIQGRTNPGSVDMQQYYMGKGISYQIEADSCEVIEGHCNNLIEGCRNRLVNDLYHIRCWMSRRLEMTFDSEDAAVLKTMILGDKSSLDSETKILYQRCGIVHILAISGLHVALIAGVLEWLLERLRVKKNVALVIVMVVITLYGVMTGMSEATLRALIMLIIGRMAFLLGRSPDLPTSMVEALLVMVVINPDCLFSTGMIMSYAAVMGIITGEAFSKLIVDKSSFRFVKKKKRGYLRKYTDGLLFSTSINLWMTPILIRTYYEIPVLSLLLNLIIIPLLTIVISCGVLAVFAGLLSGNLAVPFVWVTHIILSFYKNLCRLFIKIPFAIIVTGHIEIWQMGLMYLAMIGIIGGIYLALKHRKNDVVERLGERWRIYLLGLVFSIYIMITMFEVLGTRLINDATRTVVFLDVGQGDGSILHLEHNYIVDSGSTSNESVGQYTLIPALKYYAMSDVRCIFISHMDLDHMNGVAYLLENAALYGIKVENLAVARGTLVDENFTTLLSSMSDEVNLVELGAGDVVDNTFSVLYPTGEEPIEHSGNDYSLVLDMHYENLEILYTGDISSDAEQNLLETSPFSGEIRVLKCPHHGSRYSGSEPFLRAFNPDITVISCGKNNSYGHPAEETLKRLRGVESTIYRTDIDGAVIIQLKKQ